MQNDNKASNCPPGGISVEEEHISCSELCDLLNTRMEIFRTCAFYDQLSYSKEIEKMLLTTPPASLKYSNSKSTELANLIGILTILLDWPGLTTDGIGIMSNYIKDAQSFLKQ